jgi:hypothetical protein
MVVRDPTMKVISITALLLPLLLDPRLVHAQRKKPAPVCTQAAFAAFKPLPKLEYECPEGQADYGEEILKLPARLAAIHQLERSLESLTSDAWWNANVDDLNGCEIHGSVGKLTDEEKQKVSDSDYDLKIFGNHQMRLAVLADPCYATGYSGSNAFLLVRRAGKVFVTQVLNGYASRFGNSVGVDFANLNGQTIVEISTANSFPPSLWYHYFVIDAGTNKAVPKKLFKEDNKLTNEIYSDMLMGEPKDFGLARDAKELNIIRNGRLAPTFSAYMQDEKGKVDGRLRRIIYRWNGRFYVPGH